MLKIIRKLTGALLDEMGDCLDNGMEVSEQSLQVLKEAEKYMSKGLKILWETVKEKAEEIDSEKN